MASVFNAHALCLACSGSWESLLAANLAAPFVPVWRYLNLKIVHTASVLSAQSL
jgi:hypothetical protein